MAGTVGSSYFRLYYVPHPAYSVMLIQPGPDHVVYGKWGTKRKCIPSEAWRSLHVGLGRAYVAWRRADGVLALPLPLPPLCGHYDEQERWYQAGVPLP